jgi:hypothetical protein
MQGDRLLVNGQVKVMLWLVTPRVSQYLGMRSSVPWMVMLVT